LSWDLNGRDHHRKYERREGILTPDYAGNGILTEWSGAIEQTHKRKYFQKNRGQKITEEQLNNGEFAKILLARRIKNE
jgi:hypothetical protein